MGEGLSILDETVDILIERQRAVKTELRSRFKKTRPFRMEPVSDDELMQKYDAMTSEQWRELMTTYSSEDIEDYRNKMETLKIRRGDYA